MGTMYNQRLQQSGDVEMGTMYNQFYNNVYAPTGWTTVATDTTYTYAYPEAKAETPKKKKRSRSTNMEWLDGRIDEIRVKL